jgi:hypothetical protein
VSLIINPSLDIIFNGLFEAHISGGKREKSRIFRRVEIENAAVYQARIKHRAAPWKSALCLRRLYFTPVPHGAKDRISLWGPMLPKKFRFILAATPACTAPGVI